MTTVLFTVSFTRTLTAITRVHTVPRLSVPPESCGIRPVQAVEGYRRGAVGEAERGPAEDPAVDRGAPDPPLQQRYPDDRDDQRIKRGQQDGGRQLPHALDVLDHAALLPRLPGQLDGGRRAAQQQAEQGQVAPGDRGGRRRDADGGQVRGDDRENEGDEPARLQRPKRPVADSNPIAAASDEPRASVPSSYGCRLATHVEARRTILPHCHAGRAQNVKTRLLTGRRIPPLWATGATRFYLCIRAVA